MKRLSTLVIAFLAVASSAGEAHAHSGFPFDFFWWLNNYGILPTLVSLIF